MIGHLGLALIYLCAGGEGSFPLHSPSLSCSPPPPMHSSHAVLLKTCSMDSVVCAGFGLGGDGVGLYEFFLFFALALLLLLLLLGIANLFFTGYVPKIILVARQHSVPPSVLLRRTAARQLTDAARLASRSLGL